MLKYNTLLTSIKHPSVTVKVGQGYIQHEIQYYFINNTEDMKVGKLVSEEFIMENFKVIK